MVGFSAGADLTLLTALHGTDANPVFIGIIYGPMGKVDVPANAPMLFVALASDDPFFGKAGFGIVESWKAAQKPVEFHMYEQGGHGFGMYQKTTTSTGWFDAFADWLHMHGYATGAVATK
jgi:dienelactone hydrolase